MMLKSAKKTETNIFTLEVSIPAEIFKAEILNVYKKKKNQISIPGFRKGKVPMHMLERFYGKGVFYEDALDNLYPSVVSEAIKESGIDAVSSPFDVDVTEIGDNGVEMTMKVYVKPELETIEIGEYKGLKAEKAEVSVSAAEVKEELEKLRERNARLITVEDRAVQSGDITVIDFEGFTGGVAFDGGKGEDFELTIGSGQFIPGFEDQIIGHTAGESFDVNVTFPEEYDPKLAGKDAVFKVTVKEIQTKELPELDDEFAKDVSDEADTLAALKKSIKADLLAKKQAQADKAFESALLEQIAAGVQGEIPEAMYDNKAEEEVNAFAQRLASQGMSIDMYMKYTGMDMDAMKANMRPGAEKQVKLLLAIEKIAQLEGITASDEEVEAKYAELAEAYKMDVEQLKKVITAEDVRTDIVNDKTVQFIVDNAIAEAPAKKEETEKPKKTAKKTASKKADKAEAAEEPAPAEESAPAEDAAE